MEPAFFAMLPLANNAMDYLAGVNIPDELQGRAWWFIGFLSQIGYVIAYALLGLSDGKTLHQNFPSVRLKSLVLMPHQLHKVSEKSE